MNYFFQTCKYSVKVTDNANINSSGVNTTDPFGTKNYKNILNRQFFNLSRKINNYCAQATSHGISLNNINQQINHYNFWLFELIVLLQTV